MEHSCPFVEILEVGTVTVLPDKTGAVSSGKITLCGHIKQARRKGTNELWGAVSEQRVGFALLDFQPELVEAADGSLWYLRVFEYRGRLLKPSGETISVLEYLFSIWMEAEMPGKACFEDNELLTLTLL